MPDAPTPRSATARSVSRRDSLKQLAALALAPVALPSIASAFGAPAILRGRVRPHAWMTRDYSARAVKLIEESVVVDMLDQFRFADYAEKPPKSDLWLKSPKSFTKEDYEVYRTSGIRVFALGQGASDYESGVRFYADWNSFIAGYDEWLMRIDDVDDFERVKRLGKVGIMLTFQNSDHFRSPADVDTFFALGQRVSQLTYNFTNRIGSGFLERNDGGLTMFGSTIVDAMNRVGMAVDLSHCGDRTTMDGIAASKKTPIFTHASARGLIPGHLRCKTDEAIRALAKAGGVMGVPMIRFMIHASEPVTKEHVLDHVDYIAKLVGIEHVGVGSDLDVVGNPNPMNAPAAQSPTNQPNFARYQYHTAPDGTINIKELDHPKRFYDLTEGLIARKYSDADIKLVLGGNWMRALKSIWPA